MNNELLPEQGWWKRNWSWAVPVGGCLTVLIIIGVSIGSIFFWRYFYAGRFGPFGIRS